MTTQQASQYIADSNAGRVQWDDNRRAEANKTLSGSGGSGGSGGFPRFSFDLETEQRAAFEKLKPFYEDLLNMSKGDLDLAKRMLEFTYTQGTRESQQEYEQATREQAYQFPQEQRAFQEEMNRRGMLQSQVTQTGQQPGRFELGESQGLRAEAVKRALENRRETLTQSRGFGLEGEQNKFAREEKNLAKDQRTEASGMAMNKFNMESAKYGAQVGEWSANESRRQFEATQALTREQFANR